MSSLSTTPGTDGRELEQPKSVLSSMSGAEEKARNRCPDDWQLGNLCDLQLSVLHRTHLRIALYWPPLTKTHPGESAVHGAFDVSLKKSVVHLAINSETVPSTGAVVISGMLQRVRDGSAGRRSQRGMSMVLARAR